MTTSEILLRLGITPNYKAFLYIISAVELCLEDGRNLHMVTRSLYPEVAKRHRTNWRAVERDIRKVTEIVWTRSRPALERLAHTPLAQKPPNAQFLAILTAAVGARWDDFVGAGPRPARKHGIVP